VKKIDTVVCRFPQHELAIHRLCTLDAAFRAACEDHEEAMAAFRFWKPRCASADPRIEQYRLLLHDIEGEIARKIEDASKARDTPEGRPPPGRPPSS
jgi:hypothetical protein